MKSYIKALLHEAWQIEQEVQALDAAARRLPPGEKRDGFIREWALTRGEARGLKRALELLRENLCECQEIMKEI